jgi:hypothetical protein
MAPAIGTAKCSSYIAGTLGAKVDMKYKGFKGFHQSQIVR